MKKMKKNEKSNDLNDKVDRILDGLDDRKKQCPICKEYVWKETLTTDSGRRFDVPVKICRICMEEYKTYRGLYGFYAKDDYLYMFNKWKSMRIINWIRENKPKKKKRRR